MRGPLHQRYRFSVKSQPDESRPRAAVNGSAKPL